MANPYKMFKTDATRETDGVVLNYGDEFSITIARAGGSNQKYTTVLTERLRPYRRAIQVGTLDNKLAEKLWIEIYADSIILGWESLLGKGVIPGADDKPLSFNRDNVIKLLTDLPELFREIQQAASDIAIFREGDIEEDEKN